MDELNKTSRGKNWEEMKSKGAKVIGRRNPDGNNYWFEHSDAGQLGIPEHHASGHIHSVNSKGDEVIFTW